MAARGAARCRRLQEAPSEPQEVLAAVVDPRVCSRESQVGSRGQLVVGMHLLAGLRGRLEAVLDPWMRCQE